MKKYFTEYEDLYKIGNIFKFTKYKDNYILWEGNFNDCKKGIYKKIEGGWNSFKELEIICDDKIGFISCYSSINGPIINIGSKLDFIGFKGYKVKGFKKIDTGYKIITEK